MPRPREFDRQEVLDRAMELFWEHGFETTSITELCRCMGIGKASLYDTFGSKENLICEAMDCYVNLMKERILTALDRPGSAQQVVHGFFTSLIERSDDEQNRCCLMAKAAMMSSRCNPDFRVRIDAFMVVVENAFHDVVERGIDRGEVATGKDPRAIARFFVNTMQGLSITTAARTGDTTLADVLVTTMSVLD